VQVAEGVPEVEPGARLDRGGKGDAAAGNPAARHHQLRETAELCASALDDRAEELPADAQAGGNVEAQGCWRRTTARPLAHQPQRQRQERLPQHWKLQGNLSGWHIRNFLICFYQTFL